MIDANTFVCNHCRQRKAEELFTKCTNPNSRECKECHNSRQRTYEAKPERKVSKAAWHVRRRVALIAKIAGNYESGIQTCCFCDFTGESRLFVKDKASPTGHKNVCLVCIRTRSKAWKSKNRAAVRVKHRQYKIDNREKVNRYAREVRNKNPQYKILHSVRRRINEMLGAGKSNGRSLHLLGVSNIAQYKAYLESLFELGMSWDNYGNGRDKWNIDHKKPLFTFDLTKPKQQAVAFHFSNTRPMWQSENGTNGSISRWRNPTRLIYIKSSQHVGVK